MFLSKEVLATVISITVYLYRIKMTDGTPHFEVLRTQHILQDMNSLMYLILRNSVCFLNCQGLSG
jgi:hypothetical protein